VKTKKGKETADEQESSEKKIRYGNSAVEVAGSG
jgi:hypothetical protein